MKWTVRANYNWDEGESERELKLGEWGSERDHYIWDEGESEREL